MKRWLSVRCAMAVLLVHGPGVLLADDAPAGPSALVMVVMDPLALELSCPCVKGYAQRNYHELARYLEGRLKRRVEVAFSESLATALKEKTDGRADLVVGKCSVVKFDAAKTSRQLVQIAALTGKDGSIMQHGLIVVPKGDPARSIADLRGYRIIFGPAECEEKHAAALALLRESQVQPSPPLETRAACDEGATLILEQPAGSRGAAVISSYARPLLEGCGTVPKGALRVVGQTQPVPFVGAFVDANLPTATREAIQAALLGIVSDPQLCIAMETGAGFVAPAEDAKKK